MNKVVVELDRIVGLERGGGHVELKITDRASHVVVAQVKLSHDEFTKLLLNNATGQAELMKYAPPHDAENIGKHLRLVQLTVTTAEGDDLEQAKAKARYEADRQLLPGYFIHAWPDGFKARVIRPGNHSFVVGYYADRLSQ